VRNDGTPDNKKYLGITPHDKRFHMIIMYGILVDKFKLKMYLHIISVFLNYLFTILMITGYMRKKVN